MASENKILANLAKFFKLKFPKDASAIEQVRPGKSETKNGSTQSPGNLNYPSPIEKFLKNFYERIKTNYQKEGNFDFKQLIDDIDDMCLGEPRINRAVETRASEILQSDSSSVALTINSKNKDQIAFIEEYNEKFKILDKLRSVADDYSKYGNHIWTLSLSNTGIGGVTVNPIRDLKDRYEFIPADIGKFKTTNSGLSSTDRMKIYLDSITTRAEITYFDKYLLGYEVGPFLLPPWHVVHFRNKGENGLFRPFGEPPYLGSLAPYKNFDVLKGLRASLLAANLPREFVGFKIENTPQSEITSALVEAAGKYENTGLRKPAKEGTGVAETIYYVLDQMEVEYKSPDLKMPDEADLEIALDDIIVSTMLPREILESKDGFGDGSGSIVEKSKYFYRMIYKDQTSILETLADHYKLAMILSGDFDLDEIDFTLSLPYPESMINNDMISNKSDLIKLAADMIEFFQNSLTGGATLPPKAVQKIMYQLLPFHADWTEDLLKLISKGTPDQAPIAEGNQNRLFENFVEKSNEYKENYFKHNTKHADLNKPLFSLIQNYYIESGLRNGRKFVESKMMKPLSDAIISSEIYNMKRKYASFKNEFFQGRHYIHSGKQNNFILDSLSEYSNLSTGKKSLKEAEYQKFKKGKK